MRTPELYLQLTYSSLNYILLQWYVRVDNHMHMILGPVWLERGEAVGLGAICQFNDSDRAHQALLVKNNIK